MDGRTATCQPGVNFIGPCRTQPRTLVDISARCIVEWTVNGRPNVMRCLVDVPLTIIDLIAPMYIRRFSEVMWTRDERPESRLAIQKRTVPIATSLLRTLLLPHLSRLDLKMIIGMGRHYRSLHVSYLIISLPRMNNLVTLSLKRTVPEAIPVNVMHFLDMVGRNCPKLRSLDLSTITKVTREGILRLSPLYGDGRVGCPELQTLLLYDCNIPEIDLPLVLQDMPDLKHLGHMETGQVVKILSSLQVMNDKPIPTKLTHINNVGRWSCYGGVLELGFDLELADVLSEMCPSMEHLTVRLEEKDAEYLCRFRLKSLKMILSADTSPTLLESPGPSVSQYILACGSSLTTLKLLCGSYHTDFFQVLGVGCPNLRTLWVVCDKLLGDGCLYSEFPIFTHLSSLLLKVDESCSFPVMLMLYLTQDSRGIEELSIGVNSRDINEAWIDALVSYVNVSVLRTLKISPGPYGERLDISMDTVALLVAMCPALETLGDLAYWKCCAAVVHRLQHRLRIANCKLRFVFQEHPAALQRHRDRLLFADRGL